MRIFVTFGGLSWQKGSAAQLVSFTRVARALRSGVEIVLESHAFDLDAPHARALGIDIVGHPGAGRRWAQEGSLRLLGLHAGLIAWAALKRIGYDWRFLSRNRIARALLDADLVVDLSGDSYRDRPGGFALAHGVFLLSAISCGKPVAIVSQSLGPFKWYSRHVTRFCLRRVAHVYARDRATCELLKKFGVNPARIRLAPDVAFCLPPAPDDAADRFLTDGFRRALARSKRPVIGLSVSCLIRNLSSGGGATYVQNMVRVIDFLQERFQALVLLVPHVVTPPSWGDDDAAVASEIMRAVGGGTGLSSIQGNPDASELKAVIARCDLFLAARMHAGIAALSSGVPTIMLSWSHKYVGLMEQMDLARFVWHIDSNVERLETLIDEAWAARHTIREIVNSYNRTARRSVCVEMTRLLDCPVVPQRAPRAVARPDVARRSAAERRGARLACRQRAGSP